MHVSLCFRVVDPILSDRCLVEFHFKDFLLSIVERKLEITQKGKNIGFSLCCILESISNPIWIARAINSISATDVRFHSHLNLSYRNCSAVKNKLLQFCRPQIDKINRLTPIQEHR